MKFEKICVLGLGYIGLPTASTFATHGLKVVGVDINPFVLDTLRQGGIHIHEPGLRNLVQSALESGNLTVNEKPQPADAFIITVPTPFYEDKRADMSYVIAAAESIVPCLRPGNLVVLESTSPPRTTLDIVAPILEKSGLHAGSDFHLVYSPERVLPGQIMRELVENARVIGGVNSASAESGRDLYAIFVRGKIILTDATSAEMVKLMENTTRDVNIAIANEFARLAERFGVDIWEAITIANLHPRINILKPGPGVGGHCIGVDPWFLVEAAPDITPLIRTARQVNDEQPYYVMNLVQRALRRESPAIELQNARIAILGLAYKPDVDDVRESPAIEVARLLAQAGAQVSAYEPFKPGVQLDGVTSAQSLQEAVVNAQVVVLLVAHTVFCQLTPGEMRQITPARLLVDAVNGWPGKTWEQAGFRLARLGVGQR